MTFEKKHLQHEIQKLIQRNRKTEPRGNRDTTEQNRIKCQRNYKLCRKLREETQNKRGKKGTVKDKEKTLGDLKWCDHIILFNGRISTEI